MKQVFKIDKDGFFIEPVIIANNEKLSSNYVEDMIPYGLYKPKWNGKEWVEGATQEEIDAIRNPGLQQPTTRTIYRIDEYGYLIEKMEYDNHLPLPQDMVDTPLPPNLYYPRYDRTTKQWVEGKSYEEILEEVKQAKINELKVACTATICSPFLSSVKGPDGTYYRFGYNERDQLNFNSQLNKINLWKNLVKEGKMTPEEYAAKFPLQWKAVNVGVVSLTEEEFLTVVDDAEAHQLTQQKKYWILEMQVKQAKTIEEVQAIEWDAS